MRDLLNVLRELQGRGVEFLPEPEVSHHTATPTGRAMPHVAALLAELERGLLTERIRAGVEATQAKGVKFGRKPRLSPVPAQHARQQIEQGKRARGDVAARPSVRRLALYRALQRD